MVVDGFEDGLGSITKKARECSVDFSIFRLQMSLLWQFLVVKTAKPNECPLLECAGFGEPLPFVTGHSFSKGRIDASVQSTDGNWWRFTGFYGNPKPHVRHCSWDLLKCLKTLNSLPWLCVGDYNEILSLSGKKAGVDRLGSAMVNFHCALSDTGLSDLGFSGPSFTWVNRRENCGLGKIGEFT
ncbi:Endonuclease/exonuclease/phosphatase [Parasponia andersonii]|uniref:Endonuclease/exonuclease/phosphatase n=1 Tax=Parasponia andersonii TaxID=3476 RepID=A0A2P5C3S1_PARAD|nr:Endonuclease/exonuclease/phosphatase [Parasponia andersonii]